MQIFARHALLTVLALLVACNRRPSRAEALAAIEVSGVALDTAIVEGRVWQDGPPWFSCAEVITKFSGQADSATVRDQVGNWKSLVLSGWVVLRDSSKGVVTEPGWCTATLTDEGTRRSTGWAVSAGPAFPTGTPRRGWTMPLGRRQLAVVGRTRAEGPDEAAADYIVTIQPNANGVATGAGKDTARYVADLRRASGGWTVTGTRPGARR